MPITPPSFESTLGLQELSQSSGALSDSYLEHVRETICNIAADPHLLDRVELRRDGARYSRTLLFGDTRLSVWAIFWPPGSQTCVHDHHCSCCFGIARGSLQERWFRAVNDRQAALQAVALREPGYVASMLPSGPNLHQMINDSDQEALSVHIYGFDHMVRSSSIHRQYEVVSQ